MQKRGGGGVTTFRSKFFVLPPQNFVGEHFGVSENFGYSNNNIGADNSSQILPSSFALLIHSIDFDCYYLHLYQVPARLVKFYKNCSCSVYHCGPPNASLETVLPLYQVNGKTVPPENHR